jgi:hypothetical protein
VRKKRDVSSLSTSVEIYFRVRLAREYFTKEGKATMNESDRRRRREDAFFSSCSACQRITTNSVRDRSALRITRFFLFRQHQFFYDAIDRQIRIALNRDKYPIRTGMKPGEKTLSIAEEEYVILSNDNFHQLHVSFS